MKITRLKLVNFIGIKHGMNLNEIEIEFGDRKIIMLNGGNGSGKSTILSQLHPFKDSFDDRKTIILEDEDGVKEIDIQSGDDLYEIVHYYGKSAKSFVKKNGVEMNENGGVKTFSSFIENEFGLTNEYFKIGKIGSNTQNFIQFTTSERKTYISKFLPDIEDYLDKFNIIKNKFRLLSNNIDDVSNDLGQLEDEETIRTKINGFESLIKSLEEEIERSSSSIAVLESEISNYQKQIEDIDAAQITIEKTQKEKMKNEFILTGQAFIEKHGKMDIESLEKLIEEKKSAIKLLEQKTAVANNERQSLSSRIISLENEIKKLELNLSGLKVSESLEELQEKIDNTKKEIKSIKFNKELESLVNTPNISIQLSKFEDFINFLKKYFNNLKEDSIFPKRSNISMFMEENIEETLEKRVKSFRNLVKEKQETLKSKENLLNEKTTNILKMKQLQDMPEPCSVDNCLFIPDALKYHVSPKEIENLDSEIAQIKKDLNEFEIKADNLSDIKLLFNTFNSYYDQMNPRTNVVFTYFIKNYGGITENIMGNLNDFDVSTNEVISIVTETIDNIQKQNNLKTELENLEYKKTFVVNNKDITKQLVDGIEEKKEKLLGFKKDLEKIINDNNKNSEKLIKEEGLLSEYENFLKGKKEIKNLLKDLKELSEKQEKIDKTNNLIFENRDKISKAKTSLEDLRKRKTDSNSDLISNQTSLNTVKNLKVKQEELEKDYNYQKLLKDALDPNKGIPLYFIKAYLEKTKDITNELLELAFDENFEINFYTDKKDFFIQVRAGENIKNDIKEASQGELALTTISISLALIEQSLSEYNILTLDEIDGPLDSANRGNFIAILDRQIEKLGIEQVFIISHNDAFDSEEMDLILLNDHNIDQKGEDFLTNKSVIFKVEE